MDLSEKLYFVRKLIALNQKEAAEKAGLKQATISILERGERNNLPNAYIHFLYQNGIDLNWIFNDDSDVSNAFRKEIIPGNQHLIAENSEPGDLISINRKQSAEKGFLYQTGKGLDVILSKLLREIEKLNTTLLQKL